MITANKCDHIVLAEYVAIFGIINIFIHVVMYFYYLLTTVKPEYKKSVWWKRHLTQLQLVST